jgi:hypothetical protein
MYVFVCDVSGRGGMCSGWEMYIKFHSENLKWRDQMENLYSYVCGRKVFKCLKKIGCEEEYRLDSSDSEWGLLVASCEHGIESLVSIMAGGSRRGDMWTRWYTNSSNATCSHQVHCMHVHIMAPGQRLYGYVTNSRVLFHNGSLLHSEFNTQSLITIGNAPRILTHV